MPRRTCTAPLTLPDPAKSPLQAPSWGLPKPPQPRLALAVVVGVPAAHSGALGTATDRLCVFLCSADPSLSICLFICGSAQGQGWQETFGGTLPGWGCHTGPRLCPSLGTCPPLALCSTRISATHRFPSRQCQRRGSRRFCHAGVWQEGWTRYHYRWTRQTVPGAEPGEMVPCGTVGEGLEEAGPGGPGGALSAQRGSAELPTPVTRAAVPPCQGSAELPSRICLQGPWKTRWVAKLLHARGPSPHVLAAPVLAVQQLAEPSTITEALGAT